MNIVVVDNLPEHKVEVLANTLFNFKVITVVCFYCMSFHCMFSALYQLCLVIFFLDVGSVEGLAYHRGWDTLYWTSYTTSTITRHTVDQTRSGAFNRETVVTMSGDDHPRAFALDECQG